jgi:hypothetical protein
MPLVRRLGVDYRGRLYEVVVVVEWVCFQSAQERRKDQFALECPAIITFSLPWDLLRRISKVCLI